MVAQILLGVITMTIVKMSGKCSMARKINDEHWVLLDGYTKGFKTFIFKKNGKFFRTKFEDIQIGLEVSPHEIFYNDEDYYDMMEYNNIIAFSRAFDNDYSFYAFEYSTRERMEDKFPELFI